MIDIVTDFLIAINPALLLFLSSLFTLLGARLAIQSNEKRAEADKRHRDTRAEAEFTQQLRLAALDQRLAAHQEAYGLWAKLVRHFHKDDLDVVVRACDDFWLRKGLYLGEKGASAFQTCISEGGLQVQIGKDPASALERFQTVLEAGSTIAAEAGLPAIREIGTTGPGIQS